jgi:hypothetical protein
MSRSKRSTRTKAAASTNPVRPVPEDQQLEYLQDNPDDGDESDEAMEAVARMPPPNLEDDDPGTTVQMTMTTIPRRQARMRTVTILNRNLRKMRKHERVMGE